MKMELGMSISSFVERVMISEVVRVYFVLSRLTSSAMRARVTCSSFLRVSRSCGKCEETEYEGL